jgi:hypothetical protein
MKPTSTKPQSGRTPEEIISRQKDDATKAKAAAQEVVPATPASTAVAVPDNRTVPERLADQLAPSFMPGPLTKFDGKLGKFVMSGDNQAISEATRYIALIPEMWNGYIKFNGEGEQPTRVGGLPYDGYEMPPRESLGDLDPNEWPPGLDGEPADPWLHQVLIPLQNAETKEILTFGTTSVTGRTAVGALLRSYNRMRRGNPAELPIIQLRASNYVHRTFGKVNIPSFVICGRTTLDGTKPDTVAADIDDKIPW